MKRSRLERGGVLVWSMIMMTGIIALMALGIEVFRVASAISQQRDSSQFAAEAALSDMRACLKSGWSGDLCEQRARQIATKVIEGNKLIGVAFASTGTIVPEFYNCDNTSNNSDGKNDDCYSGNNSGCMRLVNSSQFSYDKTRMARVRLVGGTFSTIMNIVGKFSFVLRRGEGAAYIRYALPVTGGAAKINYISFERVIKCS